MSINISVNTTPVNISVSQEASPLINSTPTDNKIYVNPNAPITNITNNNILNSNLNYISTGNADIRYYPLNSNPSGYIDNSINIKSGHLPYNNGNSTVSWISPISPKWCILRDDFIGGTNSDGQRGELGWRGFSVGGTATFAANDVSIVSASHYGHISLATPAAPNQGGSLALANSSLASINSFNLNGWDSYFVFKLSTYYLNNQRFRLGFSNSVHAGGTIETANGIWLRYDKGASYLDTGYYFVCRSSSVNQQLATNIAPDGDWHTLRMWCENTGYINFSLDSMTGQVINTSNQEAMVPHMVLLTTNSTSTTAILDYFGFMGYCNR